MYDQIIKCLVFKQETKSFSIEAAEPSTLAHLTCFQGCVWYSVTSDCVGILLDANTEKKSSLFCCSGLLMPEITSAVPLRALETVGIPIHLCPGSAQRRKTYTGSICIGRGTPLSCVPQERRGALLHLL